MKTSRLFFLILSVVVCFLCVTVEAQDSSRINGMEQVVVTGQYGPNNPEKAVQRIKIIDRQKIDLMSAQNLADVLSNELNVRISKDNILGSGMSIGGISGRNVKILIDGVPVIGRLDGNIDISQLNLYNVERIEIIEGPMSVNYGTDALAGTINLISKKNRKEGLSSSISTYYESIGTYNLNANVGYKKGNHSVSVNAGRNFFDGWNPGEEIFDFKARIADSTRIFQTRPREQYMGGMHYCYAFSKTNISYKGNFFKEVITNRGFPDRRGEKAYDEFYKTRRIDNAIFLSSYFGKSGKLNVLASYNDYVRHKNSYFNDLVHQEMRLTTGDGDQDTSLYKQFNSRGTYSEELNKVIAYEAGYDINLQTGTGRRIKNNKQFIGDYAVYASAEIKPWQELTIRPGLRYSYNTSYKAPFVPSLNIRHRFNNRLTARASYSKGFRAPAVKELYFYFYDINHEIKGNENLKAEYSDNVNASLCYREHFRNGSYKLEIAGFYNDIRDRIELVSTYVTDKEYTYVNISVYKTQGLQANADFSIGDFTFSAGGQYTGLYNQLYETDNSLSRFNYSWQGRANISYNFRKQGLTTALFYKYTGKLPGFGLDTAGQVVATYINAFNAADLTLTKSFSNGKFKLSGGCKNLFNVTSVAAYMMSSGAHTQAGNSSPVANGRLYFLRLDISLNGNKRENE